MLSRRRFISASTAALCLTRVPLVAGSIGYPFTLGVASGCPRDESVILWDPAGPESTGRRRYAAARS